MEEGPPCVSGIKSTGRWRSEVLRVHYTEWDHHALTFSFGR